MKNLEYSEVALEYLQIIESVFQNYLKRPTWDKMQTIIWNVYLLGIEVGKQEVIRGLKR